MNIDELKAALARKYGPLPGYAWAAIGAAAIVLVARRSAGKSASSSAPAFLTTPPQSAISTGLDAAGGGGGDGSTVDPAVGYGLPSVVDNSSASSTAPDATAAFQLAGSSPSDAIAAGYTAGDYYAANPMPAGTSTADALAGLSQFPATTYDFGPSPYVDYGSIDTYLASRVAAAPSVTPSNTPPAITTAPSPASTVTSPSLIDVHYLHGRDPEQ